MEQRLGSRYRLVRRLGTGMMGHLYAGVRDEGDAAPPGEDIQPNVAVRIVREDLVADAGVISHFRDQVRRAAAVRGEHLVTVHEVVINDDGRIGLVTDLSAGESLRRRIDVTGPMLPSEVVRIGGEIATALDALHTSGLTHLAVTPENVLLDGATVRLTGHCLVPVLMEAPGLGRNAVVLGMPHYVAPEIPRGDRVGPAADLYSLGIVLYELSCGVTPFATAAVTDVIRGHSELLPGRPDGIPDDLWAVIAALLAKDPAARPTAGQVADVLVDLSWRLSQWPARPG